MADLAGLVLAAGAGRRFGGPKALAHSADGTSWLSLAVDLLRASGCSTVTVVLGAQAAEARARLSSGARVVVAERWAEGMGASLAAGLASLPDADAALITLVDLPDMPAAVGARLLESPVAASTLRQAVYDGRPGHPVLAGRAHWTAMGASLSGDRGAREYLVAHGVEAIECGDLFTGRDIDTRD